MRRKIGSAIRQHWGIENSVHWTKYVTFHEDDCRIRSLHSPQNFALLRRIAKECLRGKLPSQTLRLNALGREPSFRRSIHQKSRIAPQQGCMGDMLDDSGAFLYDPDIEEGLLQAMNRAVQKKADLLQMGEHNRRLAEQWSWNRVAKMTLDVYQ